MPFSGRRATEDFINSIIVSVSCSACAPLPPHAPTVESTRYPPIAVGYEQRHRVRARRGGGHNHWPHRPAQTDDLAQDKRPCLLRRASKVPVSLRTTKPGQIARKGTDAFIREVLHRVRVFLPVAALTVLVVQEEHVAELHLRPALTVLGRHLHAPDA
eukprot:CAMPEP_0181387888 /NCGR_PEP_ID=MMETSP1106-20121128/23987_1 /TAXON_ID=81844 /ORGANISM="Mantoniella antarctica, Strain SL-175" /LENGTH=157 /DNA_ID=CAMNT_0023508353 /DNA_START=1 /DNA_END=474 /DNA_ORIENTATION=+